MCLARFTLPAFLFLTGVPCLVGAAAPMNPTPPNNAPVVLPPLPEPSLPADATPSAYLRAARSAVITGHAGEARTALEMAQTRLLSRTVDAGSETTPDRSPAVASISDALRALDAGDRMEAVTAIERASAALDSPAP